MRRRTKIIVALAIPVILICCEVLIDYVHRSRILAEERQIFERQQSFYSTFIKWGMTRMDVEAKLRERSISWSRDGHFGYGTVHGDDFVFLKRVSSPVWFCNFEDVAARFHFDSKDELDGIKEYRQLAECL